MSGPFLFAWVDASETAFDPSHIRVDEEVFSFELRHSEGDFATLELTIINPRVGLLAPGRKVWAWLAYDRSWTEEAPSEPVSERDIRPLFFGRLVGVPNEIIGETVTLSFVARPEDFADQKSALAETLKVRPFWDGIWFSPETRDNPDNVLESRSQLFHTDRVTHEVTVSDIISGEDGTIAVGSDEVFYDSVRVSHNQSPVRRVEMTANVSWEQSASGAVPITMPPIETLTAKGLIDDWPKPGQNIGGGWSVASSSVSDPPSRSPEEHEDSTALGFRARAPINLATGLPAAPAIPGYQYRFAPWYGNVVSNAKIWFPAAIVAGTLAVAYNANRKRNEALTFVLEADVQPLLTEPGDEEVVRLSMSSSEVMEPLDPGGLTPIRDVRKSVYFSTPRGAESLEYLLCVARARLLSRARAVNVDFEIPFDVGIDADLSCRKNVVITDERLPGGLAGGKITEYVFTVDGETGQRDCAVTIGCTVGKGNTVAPIDGEPSYVAEGYVNAGYQRYSGAFVMPVPGEIIYEQIEGLGADDDGVDFFRMTQARCVTGLTVTGGNALDVGTVYADPAAMFEALNANPTKINLQLKPVTGGPFTTLFDVNTSALMVPKTIDLEAAS